MKRTMTGATALSLILLATTPGPTPEGPPATGALHHPHDVVNDVDLSPAFGEDRTVFVSSPGSMNLFLVSRNGGFGWTHCRSGMRGSRVHEFEMASDWQTSRTAYAVLGFGGLQRTTDGGRTWEAPLSRAYLTHLCLAPARAEGQTLFVAGRALLWRSDDGGRSLARLGADTFVSEIECVAVSKTFASDATVAVGTRDNVLHLSRDGGASWESVDLGATPQWVTFSPGYAADGTMWVATHGAGVLRSGDRGRTFASASAGLRDPDVNCVVTAPTFPACRDMFAATRDDGVYRSRDGGESWELTPLEVEKTDQTDNHHVRLAISPRYPDDPSIYCGAFEGLHFSLDAGQTWIESNLNPTRIGRKLDLSPAFPKDGTIVANSYGTPVMVSTDRGETWDLRTSNIRILSTYSIGVSPAFERDRMALLGVSHGLRRTLDAGMSWETIYFEPQYATTGGKAFEIREIAYSPDFAADGTIYATSIGGLYKSTDRGATWTWRPPVAAIQRRVAMSPNWTKDRILFVAGMTLHRSTDDGATWSPALFADSCLTIRCAPDFADSGEAYAIGENHGVFRSVDHGKSWRLVPDALDGYSPSSLRLSPGFAKDGTIYASTIGGGLYVSRDRGVGWKPMAPLGSAVDACYQIALSPAFATDRTMFAATYDGIQRSVDGGASWQLVTRFEFYDDWRAPWMQRGEGWFTHRYPDNFNAGARRARRPGAEMTLPFTGSGFRIYGARGPDHGIAAVVLDGEVIDRIDCYAPEQQTRQMIYENLDIEWGVHSLTIRILGEKNRSSTDSWFSVDAAAVAYRGGEDADAPVFADLSAIALPGRAEGDPDRSKK